MSGVGRGCRSNVILLARENPVGASDPMCHVFRSIRTGANAPPPHEIPPGAGSKFKYYFNILYCLFIQHKINSGRGWRPLWLSPRALLDGGVHKSSITYKCFSKYIYLMTYMFINSIYLMYIYIMHFHVWYIIILWQHVDSVPRFPAELSVLKNRVFAFNFKRHEKFFFLLITAVYVYA